MLPTEELAGLVITLVLWHCSVGDAAGTAPPGLRPPYVVSTAREPPVLRCPALANHHDPVTTNHLPGGKPESAAKTGTTRLKEIDMTADNEQVIRSSEPASSTKAAPISAAR